MNRTVCLGVALISGMSLLQGCSKTLQASIKPGDVNRVDESLAPPQKRVTRYDDALEKLGVMLEAYNVAPLKVQCKPITDATAAGGVPKDLSRMVITGLNKIVGPISYIPYDPTYVFTERELGQNLNRELPEVIVVGAITEYDKGMLERQKGANADLMFGGGKTETMIGASNRSDASAGRIALDLQLVEYQTQTMVSGVQTSNSVNVVKTSSNKDFNVAIYGNGLGISGSITQKQGLHAAIRLLVETSVLELIGEYLEVPYWRCVEGSEVDEKVVRRVRNKLLENSQNLGVQIKVWAFAHGYPVNLDSMDFGEDEIALLGKLKSEYGVDNDLELAVKLWLTVPIEEGALRLKNYKREYYARANQAPVEQASADSAPEASSAEPVAEPAEPVEASATADAESVAPAVPAAVKSGVVRFGKIDDEKW